jgi:hypothetical protein
MDRTRPTVFCRLLRFLLIAGCVVTQGACQSPVEAPAAPPAAPPVAPVQTVAPATASQIADGTWTVQGTRVPGSRFCGEWLVRLTSAGGQLSGVVSHARTTVAIQNLALAPDGSFSGTTPERMVGSRRVPSSKVTGRFSGDTVSLTFDSARCPPRQGSAIRRAVGG